MRFVPTNEKAISRANSPITNSRWRNIRTDNCLNLRLMFSIFIAIYFSLLFSC